MKIHGWAYAKERPKLKPYAAGEEFKKTESGKFPGSVYAVKFEVNRNFTVIKIGETCMPYQRIMNFGPRGKLYCISPPCTNYFEIEETLHKHFAQYRVPARRINGAQPEYFNMSIPFFLSHLPELDFKKE